LIDNICFGNIDEKDQCHENYWNIINNYCFTFLIFDKQEPTGYIDFLKIKDGSIASFESGEVHDGELFGYIDNTSDKTIYLYLISICLLPEYRKLGLAKSLWNFAQKFFLDNSYSIKNLFAVIWTKDGNNFLGKFEHTKISKDEYQHPIFSIKCTNGKLLSLP
jgi:GNAT superfamily N-acetyltransferase